jgi:hypothetical protein
MTKKNVIILTVSFLAVIGFYFYLYKDSFRKPAIQISHTMRPRPRDLVRAAGSSDDNLTRMIIFAMERDYKLTSVKVFSVPELTTNKYPHAVWELTSDSNSIPTRTFEYGVRIRGMHPAVKDEQPGNLSLDTPYRVVVEAVGPIKGEHDFTVTSESHVAQ